MSQNNIVRERERVEIGRHLHSAIRCERDRRDFENRFLILLGWVENEEDEQDVLVGSLADPAGHLGVILKNHPSIEMRCETLFCSSTSLHFSSLFSSLLCLPIRDNEDKLHMLLRGVARLREVQQLNHFSQQHREIVFLLAKGEPRNDLRRE